MVKRHNVIKNIGWCVRKRGALIKELAKIQPFLRGSIVKIARVCGNTNCKCAKGEKHVSDYLTYRHKYKRKTSTIYIPVAMVDEVRQWVDEYRRLQQIMEEICDIQRAIIRQYVTEKKPKR
jgi:NAD(P)H-flavin reductase